MTLIKCVKCEEFKEETFFRKCVRKKNGVASYCKTCEAVVCLKSHHKYKEKRNKTSRNYYFKNKEIRNINSRKDYAANKQKYIELAIKYEKERKIKDPSYYFRKLLRDRIRKSLKLYSKNGKTKSCKEYGVDFNSIFSILGPKPGVNYHLDHIIPLIEFNLDISEHIKLANSSDNLRWILDTDNRKKHTKIIDEVETNPKLKIIWNIIKKRNEAIETKSDGSVDTVATVEPYEPLYTALESRIGVSDTTTMEDYK